MTPPTSEESSREGFESPLMRDLSKLSPQILLGLIIGIVGIIVFVFPFNITEYCNHGIVTTQNSLFATFISDLTGSCYP